MTILKLATVAALALAAAPLAAISHIGDGAARAGSCQGTVSGLSARYNRAKGTGFLAIRSRPTSKSGMKGELHNGDTVEIERKKGNWLRVYPDNGPNGWVFAKYVSRDCDGV